MRTNRPYVQIDPDLLERVRQIDLLSYLREFEPSNLVKVKGTSNVYCTAEHDSLKISNGKWYWWSRGFGGYSALDYLIKVEEYDFVEAVEILTGQTMAEWKPPPAPKKNEPKVLLLPPKNKDCNRVIKNSTKTLLRISRMSCITKIYHPEERHWMRSGERMNLLLNMVMGSRSSR